MKRILIALALMPFMAFATTLSDGLVTHYTFDGALKDSTGNGFSLSSEKEVIYVEDCNGNDGAAVLMDENTLYCCTTNIKGQIISRMEITNNWSIACWFKTDQDTMLNNESTSGIYGAYGDIKYLYDSKLAVGKNGINCYEWGAYWMPATLRYDADFGNAWHHLVLVANGADQGYMLFIDGKFVKQGLASGRNKVLGILGSYDPVAKRWLGIGQTSYASRFNGCIDDTRIYNRVLSSEEVTRLYDEHQWSYVENDGEVSVGGVGKTAIPTTTAGAIVIPNTLGGCPVTSIGDAAFNQCTNMTSVTIPASVKTIGERAFEGCRSLADVYYEGETVSSIGVDAFRGCYWDLIMHVPTTWQGRGRTICGYTVWKGDDPNEVVRVVSTNVVVHYMTTNTPVEVVASISADTGIVNVMTEVKGGNVAIPDSWAKGFPTFEENFGSNFTDALTRQTGKYDCNNTPMLVWQDYVAGTDPTNPDDTFTATITMVDGVPQVAWKPVLTDEVAAKRVYRKFGKVKLTDEWAEIPSGSEADYNFFKVTVEMK